MSKGVGAITDEIRDSLPSAWYSIGDRLRNICKKLEIRISGALAVAYFKEMKEGGYMLWSRYIVEYEKLSFHLYYLGWSGAIRGRAKYFEIVEDIRAALTPQHIGGVDTCAML